MPSGSRKRRPDQPDRSEGDRLAQSSTASMTSVDLMTAVTRLPALSPSRRADSAVMADDDLVTAVDRHDDLGHDGSLGHRLDRPGS